MLFHNALPKIWSNGSIMQTRTIDLYLMTFSCFFLAIAHLESSSEVNRSNHPKRCTCQVFPKRLHLDRLSPRLWGTNHGVLNAKFLVSYIDIEKSVVEGWTFLIWNMFSDFSYLFSIKSPPKRYPLLPFCPFLTIFSLLCRAVTFDQRKLWKIWSSKLLKNKNRNILA